MFYCQILTGDEQVGVVECTNQCSVKDANNYMYKCYVQQYQIEKGEALLGLVSSSESKDRGNMGVHIYASMLVCHYYEIF